MALAKKGKSVKRYRSSARVDIQQAITARGFIEHIKSSFIGNNSPIAKWIACVQRVMTSLCAR